jgi:glycosyltransferase involved in cell wall biosynthesis
MDSAVARKRIAMIIPGGIGTGKDNIGVPVLERIVKMLVVKFEVVVFSLFPVNADYHPEGFQLVSISGTSRIGRYWKLFRQFRRLHRRHRFDAIHGFWILPSGFLAVVFGKIFGVKSLVSVLGGDAVSLPVIEYGQLRNNLSRRLIFRTLKHAGHVLPLTHYLVDNLKREGFKRKDIDVIPWGIDTGLFTYRPKSLSSPVQFLHIGNLNWVKDQATLLRAFRIIHENISAHLTIIGEGPQEQALRSLCASLGLEHAVSFEPLRPYHTLPASYHQADVLLHTSLSEGQCEVVTEAMSCGVLVCGTCVGLMSDLPECCITVPLKDHEGLAREVLSLLKNFPRQQQLRESAHAWTTVHSIQWTVNEIGRRYNGEDGQEALIFNERL